MSIDADRSGRDQAGRGRDPVTVEEGAKDVGPVVADA